MRSIARWQSAVRPTWVASALTTSVGKIVLVSTNHESVLTPMNASAKQSASPESKRNIEDYSSLEKAAIVLLSVGDQADKVLSMLDDDEIRAVSEAMSNLGVVRAQIVDAVVLEFFDRFNSASSLVGTYEHTQRMLAAVLPADKVDALMEELRGPAGRNVWDKLANVSEEVLAGYLANEYPQTVAVILTKLRPDFAARVLSELPDDFATQCIERMLNTEPVSREVLEKIETTLRTEFISNLTRASKRDSHEVMAEIFNNLDRQTEARFLGAMEARHLDSANRIKALMFVFEDLAKLDSGGVQTLLRSADKADLALSLKGASEGLRSLFFTNMSERGGKLLREDMQSLGPVRLKDVDAAQTRLVSLAKDLAARGEIVLSDGKEDDELIY
jgi:flagellar motor switch protein FliG